MTGRRFLLRMPQWGMGIQEGQIKAWLRQEGDAVTVGEPVAEVETAKAVQELVAPASGRLERIIVPAGQVVAVRSELAVIRGSLPPD